MFKTTKEIPAIEVLKISNQGEVIFKQSFSNFVEPKMGQKSKFATYGVMKGEGLMSVHEVTVRGKARVHGIECFEIVSSYSNMNNNKSYEVVTFDRCTSTHVQSLAFIEEDRNGVRDFYTFKDEHFMEHWAIGENNCGIEIHQISKGIIVDDNGQLKSSTELPGTIDIVGTYTLKIDNQEYETVRLVYIGAEEQMTDFFIDKSGREIMHRYFIPDSGFNKKRKDFPYSHEFPGALVVKLNERNCICSGYVIGIYEE